MIALCLLCGDPADDPHHVTGRGTDESYLDPELVSPLCHSGHELVGDDWRTAGVYEAGDRETSLELLELRLARLGMFFGRLAKHVPGPLGAFLALVGLHLARWRAGLAGAIVALDRDSPGWRDIPGV